MFCSRIFYVPRGHWRVQCLINFTSLSLIVFTLFSTWPEVLWMFYFSIWGVNLFLQGPLNAILPFINNRWFMFVENTHYLHRFVPNCVCRWRDCSVTMQPPVVIKGETIEKRGEERSLSTQNDKKWCEGWILWIANKWHVKDPGLGCSSYSLIHHEVCL